MHTTQNGLDGLEPYIRNEVKFPGLSKLGSRGMKVERIQSWLQFHNLNLVIDGKYGPVTQSLVRQFQSTQSMFASGEVDAPTYAALVAPMMKVLEPLPVPPTTFNAAVATYANIHLRAGPIEINGQNTGPWVRMYMRGNDGPSQSWCAGFVRFVMSQAAEITNTDMPIAGHVNCDSVADQAKDAGLWMKGGDTDDVDKPRLVPGSLFLAFRAPNDYGHIGIITNAGADRFETIEGNTNEGGSSNGYKVFSQSRGYSDTYDFIVFDPDALHVNNIPTEPIALVDSAPPVEVRRYFYEGLIPNRDFPEVKNQGYVYGSLFSHWGGWITAGHVIFDANHNPPPYANPPVIYRPGGLDAGLVGCTLPPTQPPNLTEQQPITVCGFPAGSAALATRKGAAYMYRNPDVANGAKYGRWIIRIDEPSEPVVSGMSGGVAVDSNTGEIVGIITHSNSPGNIDYGNPNPDPEDDHSLDIVSLHDVWDAIRNPGNS